MSDQDQAQPQEKKARVAPPTESLPDGWGSESKTDGFRDNKDGSVTVRETVVVVSPDGKTYAGTRVMRLLEVKEAKEQKESAPNAEPAVAEA